MKNGFSVLHCIFHHIGIINLLKTFMVIAQKILDLSTFDKFRLKCGVIDGSVVDGKRERIFLVLFKINQIVSKFFPNQNENKMKKTNKSVSKVITFCLEDDNHEEVDFK